MPIEIRELVIKATVTENQDSEESTANAESTEEIVKACVEQVLEILKEKQER